MHFNVILPIAIVLGALAVSFAGLLWKLRSRPDQERCTVDWLDSFSVATYAPMERLLDRRDIEFLASQAGYHPKIGKRLMAERRKVFAAYLKNLIRDFNQLVGIGKLMIVYSSQDQREFARYLWRQQVRFYVTVSVVRLQLAMGPWGWTPADAGRLVAALSAMRNQVQLLAMPDQAQFEGA